MLDILDTAGQEVRTYLLKSVNCIKLAILLGFPGYGFFVTYTICFFYKKTTCFYSPAKVFRVIYNEKGKVVSVSRGFLIFYRYKSTLHDSAFFDILPDIRQSKLWHERPDYPVGLPVFNVNFFFLNERKRFL